MEAAVEMGAQERSGAPPKALGEAVEVGQAVPVREQGERAACMEVAAVGPATTTRAMELQAVKASSC